MGRGRLGAGTADGRYADCNDPALFVAEAQGAVEVTVPLDDDVTPFLYDPLVEFVLERAGFEPAD